MITLLESIGPIFNITIILLVVWLMFAILAVSLFNGKLFYCSKNELINITENICKRAHGYWLAKDNNFDNV